MKIGIVTFWDSEDNYGQVLQCYALQKFLLNKGYDVFLIKYRPVRKAWSIDIWLNRLRVYCTWNIYELINSFTLFLRFRKMAKIARMDKKLHPRRFSFFKLCHIRSTDKIYNQYELSNNPPEADVYIAGSDQIWNGVDPVFFLDFVPEGKKRIAYAPSFGRDKVMAPTLIARYLSKIDVITVREQEGIDICRKLGVMDVLLVPDPTFLLNASQYKQISSPVNCKDDFIFLYLLGNDVDFDISDLYKWGERQGLSVKYVASQGKKDCYAKEYPNVDEWISMMMEAKYVVTNSFHGMAMSIILNKNFVVIPLSGPFIQMNGRIRTTLDRFNLSDRIIGKGEPIVLLKEIDYSTVNDILKKQSDMISSKMNEWLHN